MHPVSFPVRTVGEHETEVSVSVTAGRDERLSESSADDKLVTTVAYRVSVGVGEHAMRRGGRGGLDGQGEGRCRAQSRSTGGFRDRGKESYRNGGGTLPHF